MGPRTPWHKSESTARHFVYASGIFVGGLSAWMLRDDWLAGTVVLLAGTMLSTVLESVAWPVSGPGDDS